MRPHALDLLTCQKLSCNCLFADLSKIGLIQSRADRSARAHGQVSFHGDIDKPHREQIRIEVARKFNIKPPIHHQHAHGGEHFVAQCCIVGIGAGQVAAHQRGIEVLDEEPSARLECCNQLLDGAPRHRNVNEHESRVDQVEAIRGKRIDADIVTANLDVSGLR